MDLREPEIVVRGTGAEGGGRAELHLEPLAHVGETDADTPRGLARCDRVEHPQHQPLAAHVRLDADRDRAFVTGETVDHGVLDQRLQNQARHPGARHILAQRHTDREAVGKASLLQLEVERHELQLIRETRELALAGVQQPPQQIPELHTIRGQITWDPPAAQAMVVQLGDLLRRLLSAGEREFSRLADELQFVTLYLELQQKRFADRLTIRVPVRDDIARAWVPSLILQPLVENAVVHGLAGHEGPVVIRVEAYVSGERLVLRVLNTIAPGKAIGLTGIGIANVRERLEVQFGDAASFTAGPADDDLWLAEIHMPLLRDGPGGPPQRPEADPRQ